MPIYLNMHYYLGYSLSLIAVLSSIQYEASEDVA